MKKGIIAFILLLLPIVSFAQEDRFVQLGVSSDGNVYYGDSKTAILNIDDQAVTLWIKAKIKPNTHDYRVLLDICRTFGKSGVKPVEQLVRYTFYCKQPKFEIHQVNVYSNKAMEVSYIPEITILNDFVPGSVLESMRDKMCDAMISVNKTGKGEKL